MNRTEKVTEQDTGNAFVTRKQTLSSYAFNPREHNLSRRMFFMAVITNITCTAALKKVRIDNLSPLLLRPKCGRDPAVVRQSCLHLMFCFFKEKCCIFRAINSPSKGECLTLEVKSAVKSRLCYLGLYFKSSGHLDQTEKSEVDGISGTSSRTRESIVHPYIKADLKSVSSTLGIHICRCLMLLHHSSLLFFLFLRVSLAASSCLLQRCLGHRAVLHCQRREPRPHRRRLLPQVCHRECLHPVAE